MIFYSQNKKKKLYGVVLLILCAFILVVTAPTAKASNVYISDISFYESGGSLYTQFFVNTSFNLVDTWSWGGGPLLSLAPGSGYVGIVKQASCDFLANVDPDPTDCGANGLCRFTAGNTYTINFNGLSGHPVGAFCWTYNNYVSKIGVPTTTHKIKYDLPPISDTENYYFIEYPTLDIYYPQPNDEISGAFDMTGLYTLPDGSPYDTLLAMVNEPGISDVTYYGFFQMNLPPEWWDVVIRVAGVPAGEYEIFFAFMDYSDPENVYIPPLSIPITIVVGSPSEFEPGETPPPIFNILDPASYYTANSNYASSTLLFDNLSGAIKPVVLKIGDYLTFFGSKFDPDTAKETGEAMAGGVLIVRAYADNLNTFFGDLPISQALFFYLLLLVVVAVFRIVKNLINLIKP